MAVLDVLKGLTSAGGNLAAAYLPYEATTKQMEEIQKLTSGFSADAATAGAQAAKAAEFVPFSVKTGTGTTAVGAGGGYTQTLGATPASIQAGLLGQAKTGAAAAPSVSPMYGGLETAALTQATGLLGTATPTAASLYTQMQAIQDPEIKRQRLELENRLAAQGRLGVRTSAYGGTPEQLAMEKAIQEQAAANMFQAQQLAPQLAQQQQQQAAGLFGLASQAGMTPAQRQATQLANVQAALTGAYTPQQQELQALQQAAYLANIAQAAQQGQSEALLGTSIAGLEAEAAGVGAVAGLEAQRARALADALGGLFASTKGEKTTADLVLENLSKAFA